MPRAKEPNGDTHENRLANLRNLIEQWGGPKPLAIKLGYRNASFVVQMGGPNPTRQITEKTARHMEETLDLARGWMDKHPRDNNDETSVDQSLVSQAIQLVAQVAEDMKVKLLPNKLAELVSLVYADAETRGGKVRVEYVQQLVQLLR